MEPTPTASPAKSSNPPLPRKYVWGALAVAALLPGILFGALIALLTATNFNLLHWME
jgi:hypothetical protein